MCALTAEYRLVDLSYTFDAITIYPKFEYYCRRGLRNCLETIVGECNQLSFVIKKLAHETSSKENNQLINSLENMMDDKSHFQRIIQRNDVDHWVYHDDHYNYNNSHWHIKFKNIISCIELKKILNIFQKNELINEEETKDFLSKLAKRYETIESNINQCIIDNKTLDIHRMLRLIEDCQDNDILKHIHEYLNQSMFDNIRKPNNYEEKKFRGTHRDQSIIPCSEVWMRIEKAISIKIALNLKNKCTSFSKIAKERTLQLSQNLCFFNIKRKLNPKSSISKFVNAFENNDHETLEKTYHKIFSKNSYQH